MIPGADLHENCRSPVQLGPILMNPKNGGKPCKSNAESNFDIFPQSWVYPSTHLYLHASYTSALLVNPQVYACVDKFHQSSVAQHFPFILYDLYIYRVMPAMSFSLSIQSLCLHHYLKMRPQRSLLSRSPKLTDDDQGLRTTMMLMMWACRATGLGEFWVELILRNHRHQSQRAILTMCPRSKSC